MHALIRQSVRPYVCSSCRSGLRLSSARALTSQASASRPDIYDVVCVGGGPAGLSLLAALREYSPFFLPFLFELDWILQLIEVDG